MTQSPLSLAERLESSEIVSFNPCPFALPAEDDLAFLLQQKLYGSSHKSISFNPLDRQTTGFLWQSDTQATRLQSLLAEFSRQATNWLAEQLPAYACGWQLDRVTLRTEEEATRKLRLTARNDLLHFDAFPSRPTQGSRILRLYVNINPTDDRVWVTSETFKAVLEKYGDAVGLPMSERQTWVRRFGQGLAGLFQPTSRERTEYDEFMLRLHRFMKNSGKYQELAPKHLVHFPPGSAWLLFSDGISHAELRGQFALEHSFFVAPPTLAIPDEAPSALVMRRRIAAEKSRAA